MPNMSNNTSLYDYYNYDNFKVEHAPNNYAVQPRRLLPEQKNMDKNVDNEDKNEDNEYKNEDNEDKNEDNEDKNEDKKIYESDKQTDETKPGMADQLVGHVRNVGNFFKGILDDDKPTLKEEAKPLQNDLNVPDPVTDPDPVKPLPTKPIPAAYPSVQDGLHPLPSPVGAPLGPMQGGGEYDMRSLMRKNRILQNRIHVLERDLYKSSH